MTLRIVTCFPSANPARAATATERWHACGYEVNIWVEGDAFPDSGADYLYRASIYPGYWQACNYLAHHAIDGGADIVVVIGDDIDPDPIRTAAEIGADYLARFPAGVGIMNPIGDTLDGTDRVCGCPWLGRGWVRRSYLGKGPYWPGYGHFFGDTEMQILAQRMGILWQRQDVTQFHHHWSRGEPIQPYQQATIGKWWKDDLQMFTERRDAGFPESGLLP